MRRTVSIVVAGLLAVVIAATIVRATHTPVAKRSVRGAVGGAMQPFFADGRVRAELRKRGFIVDASPASNPDDDFALFPDDEAGAPAGSRSAASFWTPLVAVASAADAQRLEDAHVAQRDLNGVWTIDPARLMAMLTHGDALAATGPATSPSGSLFAALLGFVANGGHVPAAPSDTLVNAVSPVFTAPDKVAPGVPRVEIAFESSVLARADGSVVMYPNPDVVSTRSIVSFTPEGGRLARVLTTDAKLARLAAGLGYRSTNGAEFARTATVQRLSFAPQLNAVPAPPPPVLSSLAAYVDTAAHLRKPSTVTSVAK